MNSLRKTRLRAAWDEACQVAERLAARSRPSPPPPLPRAAWDEVDRWGERLQLARRRGWPVAAQHAAARLAAARRTLVDQLAFVSGDELPALQGPPPCEILRDLAALRDDDGEVVLDGDELVVVTPPIELDAFALGPFQIRLDLAAVGPALPLRIVAVDPRPAWSNAGVTHPHVSDEGLCAGAGLVPLQQALAAGRLLDAFTIVARILATYNAGSAYVALDDWEGIRCDDCAALAVPGETTCCEACFADVCDECATSCAPCGDGLCGRCATTCRSCAATFCPACGGACAACAHPCCEACCDDDRRCPTCRAEARASNEERNADPDDGSAESDSVETAHAPPAADPRTTPAGPPVRP
ncbi:MAG: hypothetical protein KF847_19340 [Pirellulales bacterium]|nr:hypothetical protein [Pirellulales bacterium]